MRGNRDLHDFHYRLKMSTSLEKVPKIPRIPKKVPDPKAGSASEKNKEFSGAIEGGTFCTGV